LVAQFQYNKSDDTYTCPQGEILKPREDGTRSGRTEQSGYQFKNTEHPCKIVQKPFMHHRTAGKKSTDGTQGVEENNKRYQENPQLYRTRQELTNIFGTIKRQWGYNHTNLTGLEK
jgi:hypothetical protein